MYAGRRYADWYVYGKRIKMIFETHAHYDDEVYDKDRDAVLASLVHNGIARVVNVGASMEGCRATLGLVEKHDFMYGALGVHPDEVADLTEADMEWIAANATRDRGIVAIGEIGLDYHEVDNPSHPKTTRQQQRQWFVRQIELARKVGLPIIIHSREAARDTEDVLRETNAGELGGIIHCYGYSRESAAFYLDAGFYFGIGGVITFKNGRKLKETVEMLPLDRLVLETDSPYLAPVPHRGERNSSLNLPLVVQEIAKIKGVTPDEVERVTYDNAVRLFSL